MWVPRWSLAEGSQVPVPGSSSISRFGLTEMRACMDARFWCESHRSKRTKGASGTGSWA